MQKIESFLKKFLQKNDPEHQQSPEMISVADYEKVSDRRVLWDIVNAHSKTKFNYGWQTNRGLFPLFEGKNQGNYSQLGDFNGQSAQDFYTQLLAGNAVVGEFAVGEGRFLRELKEKVASSDEVAYVGFDLFRQKNEYGFPFIQSNVMLLLSPQVRQQLEELGFGLKSFDVVSCAALFHHLDHNLLAFTELAALVKQGGRIFISSFPRPIMPTENKVGHALDDEKGVVLEENKVIKDQGVYARSTLVPRAVDGSILYPDEVWKLFEKWNSGNWKFEYSISNPQKLDSCVSGRIVAEAVTGEDLNVDWIFYAKLSGDTELSYILAANEQEKTLLKKKGFVSLDRIILLISNLGEVEYDQTVHDR